MRICPLASETQPYHMSETPRQGTRAPKSARQRDKLMVCAHNSRAPDGHRRSDSRERKHCGQSSATSTRLCKSSADRSCCQTPTSKAFLLARRELQERARRASAASSPRLRTGGPGAMLAQETSFALTCNRTCFGGGGVSESSDFEGGRTGDAIRGFFAARGSPAAFSMQEWSSSCFLA